MKLHRDLGLTQKTAWFMLQRIREGLIPETLSFDGPVEVDEAYFGGKERNKHASRELNAGRGAVQRRDSLNQSVVAHCTADESGKLRCRFTLNLLYARPFWDRG